MNVNQRYREVTLRTSPHPHPPLPLSWEEGEGVHTDQGDRGPQDQYSLRQGNSSP